MIKYFSAVFLFAGLVSFSYSQTVENKSDELNESAYKEPLILSAQNIPVSFQNNLKEKFLLLNEKEIAENDKAEIENNAQSNLYKAQSESFKIGSEIYYFLGAAALAAVIYFLIPDDEPPSNPVYTFGFPVTPK